MTSRTRIEIQPRRNAGGKGDLLPTRTVTDRTTRIDRIVAGVDRNDYEWGVATVGNCNITLFNDDGLFDDDGSHPNAVFPEGRDGARVRVFVGDSLVFAGNVTEGETVEHPANGEIKILVSSFNEGMRQTTIPGNTIQSTDTLEAAARKLARLAPDFVGFGVVDFADAPVATVEDPDRFNDRNLWDSLISLAEGSGRVFNLDNAGMFQASPADKPIGDDVLEIRNPLRLRIMPGYTRVRNTINLKYGSGDAEREITLSHQRSIDQYLAKDLDVDIPWITSEDTATRVATALINQNAFPAKLCKFDALIKGDRVEMVSLLSRVRVVMPETYKGIPQSGEHGGGEYAQIVKRGVDFTGRVLRYSLVPQTEGTRAEITLEAI